jgi:glycosyltransferase involved in cell wall biosynthesis
MRYLWDLYPAYRNEFTRSRIKRAAMAPLSNYLRLWDFASAARVDRFIANGANVQCRIWKTYRRESDVIHPPVDVDSFYAGPTGDYFLAVSELAPYKRIDLLVRYFSRTGRRLVIVGSGPDYRRLRASAASNVEFTGRVGATALRALYSGCRAFLMPGEEDFGITPVEALASGKPVIALGHGGALETVPAFGGEFFDEPTETALSAALRRFEEREADFRAPELQSWAQQFSAGEFQRRMGAVIGEACHSPAPGRHSPIFR